MRRFLPVGLDGQLTMVVYVWWHRLLNAALFRSASRSSGPDIGLGKIRGQLPVLYAASCRSCTFGCFRCAA